MKHDLKFLLTLITYCSIGLGVGMPLAIWLATKNPEGIDFVSYAVFSSLFGVICGIVLWVMYYIKYRK